jgi:hypothetical protein
MEIMSKLEKIELDQKAVRDTIMNINQPESQPIVL